MTTDESGDSVFGASVWIVRTPDRIQATHLALLPEAERRQADRYRDPDRRARFITGRVIARRVLSDCLGMAAEDVPISVDERRRPHLSLPVSQDEGGNAPIPSLDFNLSSTRGFVAFALANGARVGIDIEAPGRPVDMGALAPAVFSAPERAWWRERARSEEAFCRLWTLKEAVAKADGEGLGLPFGELTLLPHASGALEADLSAIGEDADEWSIMELATGVPAALALKWTETERAPVDLSPPDFPVDGFEGMVVELRRSNLSTYPD